MPLEFRNSAKRVDVASDPSLEGMSGLFICGWQYRLDNSPSGYGRIASKSDGTTGDDYHLGMDATEDVAARVTVSVDGSVTVKGTTPVPLSEWHWFSMAWSSSNGLRVFYDNVEENDGNAEGTLQDSNDTLSIGGHADDNSIRWFPGYLDDVRIYNREIADANERQCIFKSQGHDGIVDGLVARYLMNEKHPGAIASGAGSIVDLSSKGNHGTPTGSPVYKSGILSPRRMVLV